jgi:hypothetical protein
MRVTMATGKAKGSCTARRSYIGLCAVAAVLWGLAPVAAQAAPAKRYVLKHGRCKAHYVKRREKVKRREHGKLRVVTETFCVHRAAKSKVPIHAQPYTPATLPTRAVALHSHLDPSFVQSPSNPLAVTYAYSASATTTNSEGTTSAEPNLPDGFLDLYSDGLLACSINVGGSTTGGECPVTYSATGAHQVIVTYSSGSLSATETYAEQVEPYATTTHLAYKYAVAGSGEWQLELSTSLADAYGAVTFRSAPEECEIVKAEVEEACSSSSGTSSLPECSTKLTDTQTGKQIATGGPSLTKRLKLIKGETELEWNPGDTNSFTVPVTAVEEGAIVGQASCTSADGFASSSSFVAPLSLSRS